MSEPSLSASGITAVLVSLAGYVTGDTATIFFCALAGAFWPLSAAGTGSRRAGLWLIVKLVMTALALTGSAAHLLEHHEVAKSSLVLGPIAFFIAVLGDRWLTVFDALGSGLTSVVTAAFNAIGDRIAKFFGGEK